MANDVGGIRFTALRDGNVLLEIGSEGNVAVTSTLSPEKVGTFITHFLNASHTAALLAGTEAQQHAENVVGLLPVKAMRLGATQTLGQSVLSIQIGDVWLNFDAPEEQARDLARALIHSSSGVRSALTSRAMLFRAVGDFAADLKGWAGVCKARFSTSSRRFATSFSSWVSGRSFRVFRTVKFASGIKLKSYPAANECIYCGATTYSEKPGIRRHPLGAEHIIPEGLGGNLEIPFASCQIHEDITGRLVEGNVLNQTLKALRVFLDIKGKRKHPEKLPLTGMAQGIETTKDVDIADYPIIFNMPILADPGILNGYSGDVPRVRGFSAAALRLDNGLLLRKYGIEAVQTVQWDMLMFGRMLAKIGYAFAVAEVGKDGFKSHLTEIIDGDTRELGSYVGGVSDFPPSSSLHEISIGYQLVHKKHFVVVSIRLFAAQGGPTYRVVVGESLESPMARGRRVFSSRISSMPVWSETSSSAASI